VAKIDWPRGVAAGWLSIRFLSWNQRYQQLFGLAGNNTQCDLVATGRERMLVGFISTRYQALSALGQTDISRRSRDAFPPKADNGAMRCLLWGKSGHQLTHPIVVTEW